MYVACIRRANLDAMLGKSPLTIRAHRRETVAMIENSRLIGKTPTYPPRGHFPLEDLVGMSLAVDMLLKSLMAKGRIVDHFSLPHCGSCGEPTLRTGSHLPLGSRRELLLLRERVGSVRHPARHNWNSSRIF